MSSRMQLWQTLPLPAAALSLGIAACISTWHWFRSAEYLIRQVFESDAAALSHQVTSRVQLDVNDRTTASFVEWMGNASTMEAWTGFTNEWLKSADGHRFIAWTPRISPGKSADFRAAARAAYPEIRGGVNITRRSADGLGFVEVDESTADATADTWPVLYINPRNDPILGFDVVSDPAPASAIELMLASNNTVVANLVGFFAGEEKEDQDEQESESAVGHRKGQSELLVCQPVFAERNKQGGIVGCTIAQFPRVCDLVMNVLQAATFPQKYPGAAVAAFLRNDDSSGADVSRKHAGVNGDGSGLASGIEDNDQLLVDINVSTLEWCIYPRDGDPVTSVTAGRRTASFTSVVSLTDNKAIVVVMSHEWHCCCWTSIAVVLIGGLLSLVVAGLVYDRQVRLLSYKNRMKKAMADSELKSRFAANLSHEIRNLLNGVIGAGELLAEERLPQGPADLVATIRGCGRMLLGIVNGVLDLSSIEAGMLSMETRLVNLRHLLLDVAEIISATAKRPQGKGSGDLTLRLIVSESIPTGDVLADETHLRQVLVNILSNAFKFTESGSITVTAHCQPLPVASRQQCRQGRRDHQLPRSHKVVKDRTTSPLLPSTSTCLQPPASSLYSSCMSMTTPAPIPRPLRDVPGGDRAEIFTMRRASPTFTRQERESGGGDERWKGARPSFLKGLAQPQHEKVLLVVGVSDTGVGMDGRQMERLFKPYSQVHERSHDVGGTGLGLTICEALCRSMGGSIECESTPEIGSTFRFSALVAVKPGDSSDDGIRASGPITNEPPETDKRAFPGNQRTSYNCRHNTQVERVASPPPVSSSREGMFRNTYRGSSDIGDEVVCSDVAGGWQSCTASQHLGSSFSCSQSTREAVGRERGGARWFIDKEWNFLASDCNLDSSNSGNSSSKNSEGCRLSSIVEVMTTSPTTADHAFDQETRQRNAAMFCSDTSIASVVQHQQADDILEPHNVSAHDARHGAALFSDSSSRYPDIDETAILGHGSSQRSPPRQRLTSTPYSDSLQVSDLLGATALRLESRNMEDVAVGMPDIVEGFWRPESEVTFARKNPPAFKSGDWGGGREGGKLERPRVFANARRPRLLVVDDVRANRLILCKMLESLNVEVEVAKDGAEAVDACLRSCFSAVFMDITMPGGIDGFEAARLIRSGQGPNRDTHIIAVTAMIDLGAYAERRERFRCEGTPGETTSGSMTDILIKPVTRKILFAKIKQWMTPEEVAWMRDAWTRSTAASRIG